MVIDVSVVRPCMRQIIDQGIRKECGQRSCWIWAKVSGSPEEESTKKHHLLYRIGYKIGCTGDWFMMKISATTSMQLMPTHKHKFQMNSYQHCICCLDCSLYVASAIEISRAWQKQDCLKLSHRITAGVHNAKAEECTIPYIPHGWVTW